MNTLIFRTMAPYLASLMLLFSAFVLLRGHNEPGGGFTGGLVAASALAIYGIAFGVPEARRALMIDPMAIAGSGLVLAVGSGVASIGAEAPFLTGLWTDVRLFGVAIDVSTVLFFDIGVYLVVVGTITAIALALEEGAEG